MSGQMRCASCGPGTGMHFPTPPAFARAATSPFEGAVDNGNLNSSIWVVVLVVLVILLLGRS